MSTRTARLRGDSSLRTEKTGRSSPLSRISKSLAVRPGIGRPRGSRTDAWMVTRSVALLKETLRSDVGDCAEGAAGRADQASRMAAKTPGWLRFIVTFHQLSVELGDTTASASATRGREASRSFAGNNRW